MRVSIIKKALDLWESGQPLVKDIARELQVDETILRRELKKAWREKHPRGPLPYELDWETI